MGLKNQKRGLRIIFSAPKLTGRWPGVLSVLLLLAATGNAQVLERTETIRVDTDLVTINVVVSEQKGEPGIEKLRAEDFIVFEDGVRQKIAGFSTAGVPFSLVLLIDTSGSTRDEVALIRQAAMRFLEALRPADRLAIVQFNREVELVRNLTDDRARLEKGLSQLLPGSGTSFYDALQLTVDEVLGKIAGRKVVVALTDGVDSFGHLTYDQVVPTVEKAGATLYFLQLDTEKFTGEGIQRDCHLPGHFEFSAKQLRKYRSEYGETGITPDQSHCELSRLERLQINRRLYESARRELRTIAAQTGGQVFPVVRISQLDEAYSRIAAELRNVYSIAYYPTNEKHDGQWRRLRVEVRRPGLVARTRPGYRAASQ